MFKNRGFLIIAGLIVLAVVIYLLSQGGRLAALRGGPAAEPPMDLRNVIPRDWAPMPGWPRQCNFDDDDEPEWLLLYKYDQARAPHPYTKETPTPRGPIGAAIFDTQNNTLPEGVGNLSSYPATFVIPYRLLPDFYEGKGQGYLGETDVKVIYHPPVLRNDPCKVVEITILGYADGPLPTRLSIFRWQDRAAGYAAAHFAGDARVTAADALDGKEIVREVTTYNRLENHRSLLCAVRTYERRAEAVIFDERLDAFSIDFCFGAPPDPTYPEGVVVAYLRGHAPESREGAPSPATNGFLVQAATVPGEIAPSAQTRILALTNPASVSRDPAGGHTCTSQEVKGGDAETSSGPERGWLCGRESTTVETDLVIGGQVRRVVWQLISIVPKQVSGDIHWRIQAAQVLDGS